MKKKLKKKELESKEETKEEYWERVRRRAVMEITLEDIKKGSQQWRFDVALMKKRIKEAKE